MKISGADTIEFPVATVWDALLDPQVLVSTIPGCERLEATGENCYAMTVTAGVASIRGTYSGSCTLSDLQQHESLVMNLQGSGAPGTIGATVDVRFEEVEEGVTRISYEADAVVGGMVGGVGQRMLTSVSKRMAKEFFSNVATSIASPRTPAEDAETRSGARCVHRTTTRRRDRLAGRLPQGDRRRGRPRAARRCGGNRARGPAPMSDISVDSTARDQAAAVRAREISARELLDLHLARIEERNGEINAIVSLDAERARGSAAAADEWLAAGDPVGPLHGLPFAVKDTHPVAGWRTTFGSPLHADFVPDEDTLAVERIRGAGVVLLGRTNVPEFAAGSHTFNTIFGTTRNPADPSRSAGGSSGGAAAALASGMLPLADGSDMGGSLRNPASFCGVVGLRPSLGRVPDWPALNHWETLGVAGPLARNVGDAALLLSVMAGPDPRVPHALGDPGATFASPEVASLRGLRVASSVDLGGAFEVDDEVAALHEAAVQVFASDGAQLSSAYPDLAEAEDTFRTLRAWHFWAVHGPTLTANPDAFKQSLADNIRAGESLTGEDVARGYRQRTNLSEQMREFFISYDVLVMPVSQVPPFPADQEYPTEINGQPMSTYLDWMRSAYFISATGCPAISVPFGHTKDGLPVGVQIVGPHGSDLRLLEIAAGFEAAVSG